MTLDQSKYRNNENQTGKSESIYVKGVFWSKALFYSVLPVFSSKSLA